MWLFLWERQVQDQGNRREHKAQDQVAGQAGRNSGRPSLLHHLSLIMWTRLHGRVGNSLWSLWQAWLSRINPSFPALWSTLPVSGWTQLKQQGMLFPHHPGDTNHVSQLWPGEATSGVYQAAPDGNAKNLISLYYVMIPDSMTLNSALQTWKSLGPSWAPLHSSSLELTFSKISSWVRDQKSSHQNSMGSVKYLRHNLKSDLLAMLALPVEGTQNPSATYHSRSICGISEQLAIPRF